MSAEQNYDKNKLKLSFGETLGILWPYMRDKVVEQLQCVWFVIAYMIFFQVFIIGLPIVYSLTIAIGIFIVILGLAFFMEGLRLGLMPLGDVLGSTLPRKKILGLPCIVSSLIFAFVLGAFATFAEPAIGVLKQAGAGVDPTRAPLLWTLLNTHSSTLVNSVGIGVGLAVLLGVLRFYKGWSLKPFIVVGVSLLTALTLYFQLGPHAEVLKVVLGLAWDCGAVTTGPVTVPLVLSLGIGVCRSVSSGDSNNMGFGVVTLASIFPILAVLTLSLVLHSKGDYYTGNNFSAENLEIAKIKVLEVKAAKESAAAQSSDFIPVTQEDLASYKNGEILPDSFVTQIKGGSPEIIEGKLHLKDAEIVYLRQPEGATAPDEIWKPGTDIAELFTNGLKFEVFYDDVTNGALEGALWAIIPLCTILLLVLILGLRQKPKYLGDLFVGIACAIAGMTLFNLGIGLGLTPLGDQLGANIVGAFNAIIPWEMNGMVQPLFNENTGKAVAIIFAFILGYGATLAEPALNALGSTVEQITVGAFKKNLLMQSVAIGVACGIATGVAKIAYGLELWYLLIPPYMLLIPITLISSEEFVNFGWDSAGVTTGPITVPLVLAMGLGIGTKTNAIDGFGILAMASVGPIITVLCVGLLVKKKPNVDATDIVSSETDVKEAA
jgi:hypothetical protein